MGRWSGRALIFLLLCLCFVVVAGTPAAATSHCTPFSGGTIDTAGCYELTSGTTDNASTYVTINASDVVLDGMGYTVDGDRSLNPGIHVKPTGSDATNVTVRNLTVRDYYPGIEIAVGTTSIVSDITFRDVAVTSGTGWGIYVGAETATTRNVSLDNVTVSDVEDGIYYERVDGVTVTNSTVRSITDYGLRTRDSSDILVADSTFDTVGEDAVIVSDTADVRIENNEFSAVSDDALSIGDGSATDGYPTDNGLVLNNTLTDTGGIRVGGTGGVSNTTIRNNTITGGQDRGIEIDAGTDTSPSVGTVIEDNVIRNQEGGGIYVFKENPTIDQSHGRPAIVDTILRNNTVENNDDGTGSGRGIILVNTGNVTMRDNVISGHWIDFEIDQEYGGSPSTKLRLAHYRHDIDSSNTVDGQPIRYLRNASGVTVPSTDSIGALVVVDSTDITVRDRSVTNQSFLFANTTGVTVANVTVTGAGLDFVDVTDALVDGAVFAPVEDHIDDVGAVGARLIETTNVTLRNASITTVADGIDARGSGTEGLSLDNISTKMNDNVVGIRLSDVNATTITDSTVVGNDEGIDINRATNTTVEHTTVANNAAGFSGIGILNNGDDTTVHNTTIENNGGEGIDHGNDVGLTVTESHISANGDDGLNLGSGDDIRIENSRIERNDQYGIDLGNGDNVSILDTTVADNGLFNGVDGIRLDGTNHVIRNTTILNHSIDPDSVGLFLDGAHNVEVADITLRNNSYGIMADNADGSVIDGGTIAGGDTGLRVLAAADNAFRNLTLTGQTSWTFFQPDEGGSYRNNTVTNISFDGITASFDAMEVGIGNESTPPNDPTDRANIGTFLDITNNSAAGYANLTLGYDENTLGGEDESSLELWRYDTSWSKVNGATVDMTINTISRNITSFSTFAPFVPAADDTTPPTISQFSVSNASDQNITVSFNASEQLSTISVSVSGTEYATLDRSNFTETGSGPYSYTATYNGSSDGRYTATLNTASDAAGNDGANSDTDSVAIGTAVVSSAIEYLAGTQPDMSNVTLDASFSGGLLQVQAKNASASTMDTDTEPDYELAGLGADNSTRIRMNVTVQNFTPRVLIGSAHDTNWTRTNNGDNTWNLSIEGTPAAIESYFEADGSSPESWPGTYRANESQEAALTFAVDDLGIMPQTYRERLNGTIMTTDAQEFGTPRYNTSGPNDKVELTVKAPHFTKDGTNNTGFFEAFLPQTLLTEWGVSGNELAGELNGQSRSTTITPVSGGVRVDFDIHYSEGTAAITVDTDAPTATAGNNQTVDEGATVQFDGSASTDNAGVSSYNWTFGDGSNATGERPTHTYDSPGSYTVTLNASDGAGNSDTDSLTVTVESASSGGNNSDDSSGGGDSSGGSSTDSDDDSTTTVTAVEATDEEIETTDESDETNAGETTDESDETTDSNPEDTVRVASASASVRGGSTLEITLPPSVTEDMGEGNDADEEPTDESTDDTTDSGDTDGGAGDGDEADTGDPNQPPPPPVSQADIERVEIDVAEDVDAEVEIRQSRSPPSAEASEFQRDDGTQAAGYIEVTDNLADDQVTEGRLTFRLSKDDLATDAAEAENVALYHYIPDTGEWEELDTEIVGETDDYIRFRGTTPGFSQFAAGIKRAQFEISDALVDVQQITLGDSIQVEAIVTNTGGADGRFTTQLLVDGAVVAEDVLTIAAGGQRATVFDHEFEQADTYQVRVNDVVTGEIQVIDPAAASGGSTDGFVPGFGFETALLTLVMSALLYGRRTRRSRT